MTRYIIDRGEKEKIEKKYHSQKETSSPLSPSEGGSASKHRFWKLKTFFNSLRIKRSSKQGVRVRNRVRMKGAEARSYLKTFTCPVCTWRLSDIVSLNSDRKSTRLNSSHV